MINQPKTLFLFFAGLLALLPPLLGQSSEDDVIVLEEAEADDVPIEESILATSRPISSVFGTERSVLDTPRNVNIISREQLDAISIRDVRDFSKLTSSSYTKTNFGAPTAPNLRGQEADLFINGVRRGHSVNGNGVPINFNSVESVNIVKGPANAVFGTSNYVGGYVDLITKRAYFENGGSVGYSYGSFDQHTVNADVNIPINDEVAMRFSFEGKDWEGFWDRWYQQSQAIYGTVAYRPEGSNYTLDVMGEFYNGNYTENWGTNRVTQELFDDGLYIPNVPGAPADYAAGPPGGFATAAPLDVNNPVPNRREWKLSAPGDDSNAKVLWLQALQEVEVSETFKVLNNTYFHYKDRDTFSSYHYSEIMLDNWSIDNRLSLIQDLEYGDGKDVQLNYGVRFRYQDIWAASNFYNEPVNYFDLTRDPELNRVQDPAFAIFYYIDGVEPRGTLSRWYVGETNLGFNDGYARDTETWILGPYLQTDVELTERLSLLAGFTGDYVDHMEKVPDNVIPSPIGVVPPGKYDEMTASTWLMNGNASLIFKPTERTATYFTYNFSEHYLTETGGRVLIGSVEEPSQTQLFELGFNASLYEDKLYLGSALFYQEYDRLNQIGDVTKTKTAGFEIELNYQPNRNFFATIGYSFLDSEVDFPAGASPLATPYTADRADETGGVYITPTFDTVPSDTTLDNAGVPDHLINALAQYTFDNGLGLQANIVAWGPMTSGYEGYPISVLGALPSTANTAELDLQFEIDARIFYAIKGFTVAFSVFNVTDEENWDVNNSFYGNGSAVARPERNYEISVAYDW